VVKVIVDEAVEPTALSPRPVVTPVMVPVTPLVSNPIGYVTMILFPLSRLVAVTNDTTTFLLTAEAIRSVAAMVNIGLETIPPSDPDAALPPLESVLVIMPTFTIAPSCIGPPMVTPATVIVYEPALTAAVVVITLAVREPSV